MFEFVRYLKLQELGEDEKEVTSLINIPSMPSVQLINTLHWLANRIHQVLVQHQTISPSDQSDQHSLHALCPTHQHSTLARQQDTY
jgi:hypothetical protein